MNNCCLDLYVLSTIACQLSECLSEDELVMLSANLTALSDLLEVLLARSAFCEEKEKEKEKKLPH